MFTWLKNWAVKQVYNLRSLHTSQWFKGLRASWQQPTYDNLAKLVHSNPMGAPGLRMVAQALAAVPLAVQVTDGDDVRLEKDHDVLKLLSRSSPGVTRAVLFDQVVNHLYCGGELFLRREGAKTRNSSTGTVTTTALHLHAPGDLIQFVEDSAGDIVGYRFRRRKGEKTYSTDEIYHAKIYNPTDPDRGLPLLMGCAKAMQVMEAAADWNYNISKGGGAVPGYFSPQGLAEGEQLPADAVEAAEANLDEKVKERRARNLPMVLSGSFKYEGGSITPKDADFLAADKENGRKVATVIGVPFMLLGGEKQGSLTDAGVDSEMKLFLTFTVLPLLDFVLEHLNAWLVPLYGEGLKLVYVKDDIEALQEDMTAKYLRYLRATGRPIMTVDEARQRLNLDPLGGEYDELATPLGMSTSGRRQPNSNAGGNTEGESEELTKTVHELALLDLEAFTKRMAA